MAAGCSLLHIDGVEGPLTSFTQTTWTKFIESRRKWLLLSGQMKCIAVRSLEFISEEDVDKTSDYNLVWKYHIQCYRRFTDKQKIDRAMIQQEKRKAEVDEDCSTSSAVHSYEPAGNKRTRLTTQMEVGDAKSKTTGRNSFVLPKICMICKKADYFYKCQLSMLLYFLVSSYMCPRHSHKDIYIIS